MDWMKLIVIGDQQVVETLYQTSGFKRFEQRPAATNEYSIKSWLDDTLVRHEHGLYCDGSWDEQYGEFFKALFSRVRDDSNNLVVAVHVIHMHDTEHCHSCANHVAAAGFYQTEDFAREDFITRSDDAEGSSRDRMLAEAELKYDKYILKALAEIG